jgi:hypothetical protein
MLEKTTPTMLVVVDGTNAAAGGGCRAPSLRRLLAVKDAARAKWPTANVAVVVDASFRHVLSDSERAELESLCGRGEIVPAPAATVGKADAVIIALAQLHDGTIVTNDAFREHVADFPFLTNEQRVFGIVAVDNLPVVLVPRQLGAQRG